VVAPRTKFKAVVSKSFGFFTHHLNGQVSPLSGEKGNWSGHIQFSLSCNYQINIIGHWSFVRQLADVIGHWSLTPQANDAQPMTPQANDA